MKHFNRAAAILVCLFIIAAPFTRCFYSYADTVTDNWQNVTTNEEYAEAFRYYCKSRDLTIEGSAADVVTSFTTQTFNNVCRGIGIDITALQGHIKKDTDNIGNIRFLFDSTGITAYNRIFSQFLQDNELEVGDTVNDLTLKSGQTLGGSFIYVASRRNPNAYVQYRNRYSLSSNFSVIGTPISPGNSYYYSLLDASTTTTGNVSVSLLGTTYTFPYNAYIYNDNNNSNDLYVTDITTSSNIGFNCMTRSYRDYSVSNAEVHTAIIKMDDNYYIGVIGRYIGTNYPDASAFACCVKINDAQPVLGNVYITTNNQTINNNVYEGDTIINSDGTPGDGSDPDPDPSGGTPPDWDLGGGQGTAEDGNGNTWNITWPSFELPDLNIDWSIHGLSEKFPFSIPFDLVALVTVLSAEPEAPQFTGTVDLKVYQWNYDLDFSQFNTVAAVFRTAETLLFVFGLIMITRKIIRG